MHTGRIRNLSSLRWTRVYATASVVAKRAPLALSNGTADRGASSPYPIAHYLVIKGGDYYESDTQSDWSVIFSVTVNLIKVKTQKNK